MGSTGPAVNLMKKYFKQIASLGLILVIFVTASGFGLPKNVQAQTGICYTDESRTNTIPGATNETDCELGNSGFWVADVTNTPPPTPSGNCTRVLGDRRIPVGQMTQRQCLDRGAGHEWQPLGDGEVTSSPSWWDTIKCNVNPVDCALRNFVATMAGFVLQLASYLTWLGGAVLNGVLYYTVVQVSENYEKIDAINVAWKVIRDVANMSFIFILLYAAIQTILGAGTDTQRLIVRVVIIAILINFSLFFTKVVIDISNVLSLLFYDAIAPGALDAAGSLNLTQGGLSNQFMNYLNLTTLWKAAETVDMSTLITIGVMGSIMLLIAAFVFFAVALMFIIRYVILVLLLILSPLAFMGWILPEFKKLWDQWWDALSGQAFFAPIYFMLTWVTLQVLAGIMTAISFGADPAAADSGLASLVSGETVSSHALGMFINFVVVIVFLIASLLISKSWANKAGPGVTGLTKWALAAAGGASFGLAARAGRLGAGGLTMSPESEAYKRLEKRSAEGGFGGATARLRLAASDKTRRSSFDVRGGLLGGALAGAGLEGGKAQEGGYAADRLARRELLEKPGTEAYKKRQERGRKAGADLAIRDNLASMAEYDKLVDLETAATAGGPALSATDAARLAVLRTPNPTTGKTSVDEFESAINRSTDKEIEAIVETNRKLLNNQQFANRISVKQLEAINKSDKFTESEKDNLKSRRFAAISNPAGMAALAIAPAARTPAQATAARNITGAIKNLKDPELEMINPALLGNTDFVSTLRPAQIDSINKSGKFTNSQTATLLTTRRLPLMTAIAAASVPDATTAVRKLGAKEVASMDIGVLLNPTMLQVYTPQILKRMAPEMNPADIGPLRNAIKPLVGPPMGDPATVAWLGTPDGANFS